MPGPEEPAATPPHIARVYDAGLELVEPGVVLVPDWRPDPGTPGVAGHPVLGLSPPGSPASLDARR